MKERREMKEIRERGEHNQTQTNSIIDSCLFINIIILSHFAPVLLLSLSHRVAGQGSPAAAAASACSLSSINCSLVNSYLSAQNSHFASITPSFARMSSTSSSPSRLKARKTFSAEQVQR